MDSSLNEATASPDIEPVFSRTGIRNIAVAGPATADKAAVVEGWKAAHDPSRWLTVSVPHFNGGATPVSSIDAEEALINQVVCQMDPLKSPKTRFRAQMKRNHALDAVLAAVFAAFVALTIFLAWVAGLLPSQRPPMPLCVLALAVWLACIGFGAFCIARAGVIGKIARKLGRKGSDIELAAEQAGSPLERYMGELVYLLDTNGYDVVVFEGLDTYRYLPLFERLRALNTLANARRDGRREPLRFIYLVSDGLFADPHDRAAFFDHIVPIIPFVESADVLAQFEAGLAEAGVTVDDSFLADLSLFVDDPNILRDIVDEVRHYKKGLLEGTGSEPGDVERMVALLAYKALFPRDFNLLQDGKGYVHALLASRDAIVEELQAGNLQASSNLAAEVRDALEAGDDARAAAAQGELEAIQRADLELSRMPISALVGTMADADAFYANPPCSDGLGDAHLHSVTGSPYFPFIRFAVGGGWVDATYERFLSNFYTESLTSGDRGLIAAIAQGASVDENRIVRNPHAVASRLDANAFTLASARVFGLANHLLANGPTDKLKALFAGIAHDDDSTWLLRYTESGQLGERMFEVAESLLDNPLSRIIGNEDVDAVRRRRFCHRLLANGSRALASDETRLAVLTFAKGDPHFLAVDCVDPMAIAEGLLAIDFRATALETQGCSRELMQFVYDHDLYEPSALVVDRLVAFLLETGTALERGFLVTRVFSLTETAVKEDVEQEADLFARTLLAETPVKLNDSAAAIAWFLGLETLEPERAIAYLYKLSDEVVIDRIADIGDHVHQGILIDRNLVECTPANILDYFAVSDFTIDEHLAMMLQANPFPANFTMATTEERLGQEAGFLKAVLACAELTDEKVDEIASAYRAQFNRFDVADISAERAALLIDNGTIRTTADNVRFVRANYPQAAVRFALADPKTYLRLTLPDSNGNPAECGFSRDEALAIFASDAVDDTVKAALLGEFDDRIAMSTAYSDELNTAIATRHFDAADLLVVDELYAQGNRKLKRALAEAVVPYCGELTDKGIVLSIEMASDVAWRLRAEPQKMVSFIASQIAGREETPTRLELRDMFERAGLSEYVALIDGPSSLIPDTPEDDRLLAALSSFNMAGKQIGKTDERGLRRVNSKGYSRK